MSAIRISEFAWLKVRLYGMQGRASDATPVWPVVGARLSMHAGWQFMSQGRHLSRRQWHPLQPRYLAWKLRNGYPAAILIRTTRLFKSYTSRPMGIELYSPKVAAFGSNVEYASFHAHRNRGTPARTVLKPTLQVRKDIKRILEAYFIDGRLLR